MKQNLPFAPEQILNSNGQQYAANTYIDYPQEENDKKLKALEIIKSIGVINVYEDVGGKYHLETMADNVGLTKEDYELLKEVLNYGK